jgi:Carboxypeptidase regulatory-like domain/TonB-dependent Receptor Plug Domain
MKSSRVLLGMLSVLMLGLTGWAQTGSITGTVKDPTGAAIAGATVVVTSPERGITRQTTSNSTGEYNESALAPGSYDIIVTATGFKKYSAKGVKLDVGEKARVDVPLEVGAISTEVVVQGENVAQVETQSSELAGTVTGKEITQLELNGRNFTTLVSLVPGVSNQTGMDEPQVGINGSVAFSMNGGRTEYNNWELDGGDNMDNGSNGTLNVYPSVDAIAEFKVLTSNYGAQYGRNGSGTVEVDTKSGTKAFHGDVYEFVRNDAFNANNYFNSVALGGDGRVPAYKKNDYGYTLGGPVYIPGVYNKDKQKTFFFWSEEWRRERVPASFNQVVPYSAERTGDFSDLCPNPSSGSFADCPVNPATGTYFTNNQVPVSPAATALLPLIPVGTLDVPGGSAYNTNITLPTSWREELFRIDHNINDHNRVTFRYIHDSWNTVEPGPIWDSASFPTVQTAFNGPGVSMVARLTSTISPTLLNEFVASYTTDHISFKSVGAWQRPSSLNSQMGFLFNNGFAGKLPAISLTGGVYDGIAMDPDGIWPEGPYNSNPTYTYRDNLTKIVGRHNLTFGAYFVAGQKNELSSVQENGALTFDVASASVALKSTGLPLGTGNPFADLLMGNIASFAQGSNQLKFYNRYKIVEPYFQDDWRVTDRLTLNLGVRISFEGTYRERYHHAYNWDPSVYTAGIANAPVVDGDGSITGTAGALVPGVGNPLLGLVQCGGPGGTVTFNGFTSATIAGNSNAGCLNGHLFNPAPRIGFAWDPRGDGKTAIRGGYGVFFEHANGNEANTEGMEGQTSPLLQSESQPNIPGYLNIGSSSLGAPPVFPSSFYSIPKTVVWPYMQQWHLDVQRELPSHTVVTVSYVGSKGTHLGRQNNLNQLFPTPASQNPYLPGQQISAADCGSLTDVGLPSVSGVVNGQPVTGQTAINLQTACGNDPNPYRPFQGIANITRLESKASSIYHALQVSARKSVGALNLTAAYTYSHSIDDSSDRYDGSFVNSYDPSSNRASSSFDQRHMLNVGYVYDLPLFKKPGISHTLLGGWEWSGIFAFSTGTPLNVTNGTTYGDNAGVGNGVGTGSYPDVISNPRANIPPLSQVTGNNYAGFFYNPNAFVAPTGLTFGNVARNYLRNPNRTNVDMGLFKHFAIKESMAFEFRAEAFNVFNHTEFGGPAGNLGGSGFLEIASAHLARVLQLGAKFIF